MTETNNTAAAEKALLDKFLKDNVSFIGPDKEINKNHHVNPRSLREDELLKQGVNSHKMAEIRSNLQSALDETFGIAEQTVASPAASCGDMSTGYFTPDGDLAIASTFGVAGFTVTLHYAIRWIMKYFKDEPTVGFKAGDGFLLNDARFGGIHSPDQHLFMPVFDGDEHIGWTVCAMHEGEIGARDPGGMGPSIESIWDEGFRGTPIKLVENYLIKRDLASLVQHNSREPHVIMADFKARLSACMRMERRMKEQVAQYGVDAVIAFMRSNVEYMAEESRRRVRDLPDGTARVSMYMDHTMREHAMMRTNFNFTVKGDRMIVDMRGSSPEIANRPINALTTCLCVGVSIALAHQVWPDLPCSQAIIDCFEFVLDENTVVAASELVPTALSMQVMFKIVTACEIAMSKFYYGAPTRYANTKAGWFNQPQAVMYGGINQHHDSVGNMCGDLNGMAGGAKFNEDGEHSIAPNFGCRTDTGESEEAEEGLPFVSVISKKIWPDNVGFGKFRGGAAYSYGMMRFGDQPFGFQTICGGSYFPSTMGLFGGYACTTYGVCRVRGKNLFETFKQSPDLWEADIFQFMNEQAVEEATYESLPSAVLFDLYAEGELFMQSQGAGGGYGDVLERDTDLVVKDLEEGVISHETAREIYFVVYNEETLIVDRTATEAARSAERKARVNRGQSWDEFVSEHVTEEPPADVPYFGSWNGSEELYAGPYGKGLPGQLPLIMMPDPKDVEIAQLKAQLAQQG
ncbi:MAG: acetone carboxylase subunit alpha [Cellvibrionaceae bacterium]|nr:acetone carboxylase subunit alpha [Cellvibrionaceae bacterium]|tara:strand:+ start:13751 stop:15982 length:2232 start_codon:yes stop_codon:yes gene_type:complete